jgi:HAD superfamily hydrolase (TIGR01509 family)
MAGYEKIHLIIYDCDGVLFESKKANLAYYNHILKEFGKSPIEEKNRRLVNIAHTGTTKEVIEVLFQKDPRLEEIQKFAREVNYIPFLKWMKMEPGLMEILELLEDRYKLSIATNRGRSLNSVLKYFNLNGFFKHCVTSLEVNLPKPHPDYLLKIVNRFNIAKEETLYIGDSEVDLETAKGADIRFIAYKNDLRTPLKINHHLELRGILGI